MPALTYDRRSFMLDGKRLWLVSGTVQYFRIPPAQWQDRLTKAVRGGLNCIETYIPWNFHEPTEGNWQFSGDHDVVEFIKQAGDMGLYVIVRPGPYICSEWDFGGLPGWLSAKANIQYRNNSAVYTHYYEKYLRQVLARIVPLQVTQGGNIILIQNENEYFMTTQPDRQEYLDFITQVYRRAGVDVPIITCNILSQPLVNDTIECINTWSHGISMARKLKVLQPEVPLLATEFWSGWFDTWGAEHSQRDPRHVARRALELLGAGAQINYYTFTGGTNFAFWGGRTVGSDHHFITTSYDFAAPVSEGGGLTRAYYLLRLVNVMAQHMSGVLAQAEPVPAAVSLEHTATLTRRGAGGRVTVVTNNGDDAIEFAAVMLDDGRELKVDLRHFGAAAVFSDVPLSEKHVMDYSSLMPLGVFGELLVLHGMPGQQGAVSINGQEISLQAPKDEVPLRVEHQGLNIIVMTSGAAERCWQIDGRLIVGPSFIGETMDELALDGAAKRWYTVDSQGLVASQKPTPHAARPPKMPTLGTFKRAAVCQEAVSADGFVNINRPRPLSNLGVDRGYGWYRVAIDSPRRARSRSSCRSAMTGPPFSSTASLPACGAAAKAHSAPRCPLRCARAKTSWPSWWTI